MVDLVVGCYLSSHDQQGNVGHDIEHYEDNLGSHEERVNHYIVGIARDWESFALRIVHPITGKYTNYGRENKPGSVDDCTPHEKPLKHIDIHNVCPFPVSIRSSTLFFYMEVKLL